MEDSSGTTEFAYDDGNRLVAETRTQDGRQYTVQYEHDGLGNITQMTYRSGLVVRSQRQASDPSRLPRVVGVESGVETVLADETASISAGLLTSYRMGNGLVYAIERGPGGRVERITTGVPGDPTPDVLDVAYFYDSVGNIISIVDAVDPDRTGCYRCDALDRPVGADGWWGALEWTYSATGNRLSETRNGGRPGYIYLSGSNRLLDVRNTATGATEQTLEYDASGNATRYNDLLLDYDAADRLVRTRDRTTGATVQENACEYKLRRTRRTDAEGCSMFLYDLFNRPAAEQSCTTGAPLAELRLPERLPCPCRAPRRSLAWVWLVEVDPTGRCVLLWGRVVLLRRVS